MYLSSLVLKGFKSFADRSILSLEPGITAIVGPNGSGKSNISDAVLWVLGERNARNLRGQAMEDVIFAGSSARKAVGIAEVDLVLNNADGTLPIDYSEVVITRRMYRSGESEYLINGALSRRMDVLDILHDSGLGTGTHSIISQGHLDAILQSKPEDRRALIEEAAGVLKHKQRKQKSARKLEQMDIHLSRVKDVVAEVERQLKPLHRKADRALAYQDLADELAALDLALAVDDLRVLRSRWDALEAREKGLSDSLERLRDGADGAETRVEALQQELRGRAEDVGVISDRHRRAQSASEHLDSAIALIREKKRAALGYRATLSADLEADRERLLVLRSEGEGAVDSIADLRRRKESSEGVLSDLEKEREAAAGARTALESRFEELADRQRDLTRTIEGARAEKARARDRLAEGQAREKMLAAQVEEVEGRLAVLSAQLDAARTAASADAAALSAAEGAERDAQGHVAQCLASCDAARAEDDRAQAERARLSAQVAGMEDLARAREAENPSASWMREQADALDRGIEALAASLGVPEGLEGVVEQALGPDIEAFLVSDPEAADRAAAGFLAAGLGGSLSLVPKTGTPDPRSAPAEGGVFLVDMIDVSERSAAAVNALLGDVVVFDDARRAREAWGSARGAARSLRYASRDGLIIWPHGKRSVGRKVDGDEGALHRHRALEEMKSRSAMSESTAAASRMVREQAERDLAAAQEASLDKSRVLARLRGRISAAKDELARIEAQEADLTDQRVRLLSRREQVLGQLEETRPATQEIDGQAAALEQELESLRIESSRVQAELSPCRDKARAAAEALSEARLAAATISERLAFAERGREARVREMAALEASMARSDAAYAGKDLALGRVDPLLAAIEAIGASARSRAARLADEASRAQRASSGMHGTIEDARRAAQAARASVEDAAAALSEARVEKGRLEVQVEGAIGIIVRDCGTPLETALRAEKLEDRAHVEDRAFKLRRRIANMGTINPDAAAEYRALKERYDYLSAQLDDMMSARRALEKIVHVIDARMKDDFVDTFAEVDRNFREIFAELFPGGSAELSLVDPGDPETTGVEVTAQPRGKRITKMMLMSGGEKSLTAMALLFAVYRTRSTPFYILDEVEAALDDTNLRRLCAYLGKLRESAQLIMITHQRRTMEMADVLYGVSMQADGVTKLVSQKLDRALPNAEG